MKLILLVGKPQTGKTTTLNLLYNEMYPKHASIAVGKTQVGGSKDDFECILDWTGEARTLKVGIFTMGDYYRECVRATKKYSKLVDVLVLAYSDKFKSGFGKIVAPYPSHFIVHKTVATVNLAQDKSNQHDVLNIIASF